MNRRSFSLSLLGLMAGCVGTPGGNVEFPIQPTPVRRTSKQVFGTGVFGTWTPSITFATPGDLSIAPASASGIFIRDGWIADVWFYYRIDAPDFTHTTASGVLRITGLPVAARQESNANVKSVGSLDFSGITKANYTHYCLVTVPNQSYLQVRASGSGQLISPVSATDMPTGGTVELEGYISYIVADFT